MVFDVVFAAPMKIELVDVLTPVIGTLDSVPIMEIALFNPVSIPAVELTTITVEPAETVDATETTVYEVYKFGSGTVVIPTINTLLNTFSIYKYELFCTMPEVFPSGIIVEPIETVVDNDVTVAVV